jgi:hypothetical protein
VRCSERGAHDDLEHPIVAILRLEGRDVIIRHLIRVMMNFVDERLQLRRDGAPVGGRASDGRIAFASAVKDALKDAVAEGRVGVGHGVEKLSREPWTRNFDALGPQSVAQLQEC